MNALQCNLLIIGHKQHGKGTLAKLLKKHFDFSIKGTSIHNAEMMFSLMKDSHGYSTVDECYQDRGNHREYWFKKINDYCKDNLSRVIEEIFADNDGCEGIRNREEFECAKEKNLFDLIIWVDASKRKPLEPSTSMQLTADDAHLILDNNSTEEAFEEKALALFSFLFNK